MTRSPAVPAAGAALALLVCLSGCGGGSTSATTPSAPAPASSAPAASSPASSPSPSGSAGNDQAFVTDVKAKVDAGDYTPPKGVKKDVTKAKSYLADLADERLVLAGKSICTAAKQGVTKAQFVSSVMQNPGTEDGFKQLTPLTWDEAETLLCQG